MIEYDLNGMMFFILDRDNDKCSGFFYCVFYYKGGWWFKCCGYVYLNGFYNMFDWWGFWYFIVFIGILF